MTRPPPEIYRLILHETPNPTVVTDEAFGIVDVNQACLDFTGYTREEMLGSLPTFLVNDPETYEEMVGRLDDGESWEGELEAVTKDGDRVFGRGATFPLVTEGAVVGYAGIFIDLSELRRNEQTVNVLNRVLRHNIRNDANVIAGALATIRHAVSGPDLDLLDKAAARVDRLLHRAETARDLHELLDRTPAALTPVDLRDVVTATVPPLVGDGATLDIDAPDDPVWVLADDALSRAVVALVENAVENAVEYTDVEAAEIDVGVETTPTHGVLTVEDNGPGIDPDRVEFLFGRREDSQLRHGQGLSLFFVDRLLEFYGGSVSYRPREPTGCVFELRFRRVEHPS